ncbi:hypothetical protein COOONC_13220 [Cooperia oncophora]
MTATFVLVTFMLCSMCYGTILRFLIKNRFSNSGALKRERRLYVQMLGLFVGFVLLVVFYILQFTFSLHSNVGDRGYLAPCNSRKQEKLTTGNIFHKGKYDPPC